PEAVWHNLCCSTSGLRLAFWRSSLSLTVTPSPVSTEAPDRLIRNMAGDVALPCIPQDDPIEAQRMLCLATTLIVQAFQPQLAQLDTLSALEHQGQSVSKRLLTRYVEGDGKLRSFDWRVWQAAIRLSQAFYQANGHFLRYIRDTTDDSWIKHEPSVLVRLFQHRKAEFLLRFLRYKKRNSGQWRELHAMYLRAHEADQLNPPEANCESDTVYRTAGKLEQQYVQILLLEAMNGGQFSPREALWAHRWFARWCNGPGLQLTRISDGSQEELSGFVVDLGGSDGLKRGSVTADNLL